jgi:thiol-disulfide isomerase/thioredoxin
MIKNKETKDVANSQISTNSSELIFFFAEWCPHCKTAKPIWEKVSADYNGKVVNGYKLNFSVVNCTNSDDADVQVAINKYKVEHFPTIKLLKDNNTIEFDSKISEDNLVKFFNIVLNE